MSFHPTVDCSSVIGFSFDVRRCHLIDELGIIDAAESLRLCPHVSASPHLSEIFPGDIGRLHYHHHDRLP